MAFPEQIALLLLALLTISFTTTSEAVDCVDKGKISVYWGQGTEETEGTLRSVCSSGNYNIVILESLLVYDDGKEPDLNLAAHCTSSSCAKLQPDIEFCQKEKNMQVFLSIGQDRRNLETRNHRQSDSDSEPTPAEKLASYLLEKFLSGNDGPLGKVSLDGIDVHDVADGENLKWDEVFKAINASTTTRKIYLSASPQCVYPDFFLDKAISTGLLDYIWVEFFYQDPCIYSDGDPSNLLSAWEEWTKNVPNSLIFLGLTASKEIKGYICPQDLISKVLPSVKKAHNYGGVMISSRADDIKTNYTPQIHDSVLKRCTCVCEADPAFASI